MKNLSIVIPLYNEEESLPELHAWIKKVMDDNNFTYEIWFISDGSTDKSWDVITEVQTKDSNVRGIKFRRNFGKSAALYVGFDKAEAEVIITMDADLQDSPEEIPELYKMVMEDGYDLVSGWKQDRKDPLMKTIPTKLFNKATSLMSGIKLNDFNCGLKAYKYDVVKSIEVYGEMHRYIPVMAKRAGFTKIGEKPVKHFPRKYGTTKFGLERFINGLLDLVSIIFMSKFGKRPMHLFGTFGFFTFLLGFGIGSYLIMDWIMTFVFNNGFSSHYYPITQRPIFYFSLMFIVVGTQMFLSGFVAEILVRNSTKANKYDIEKTS
ncbi:MAG: glycosyltransferase involved in cell wall biosynthesis [Saprospiraceae bacterium]|jgi:glycosyltransferase involved in cell wall biosynthesis